MIDSIRLFIFRLSKYISLNTIVYFPVLMSGVIFVLGYVIGKEIYVIDPPRTYVGSILLSVVIVASLSGVIQILIEETPGWLWPVQGKTAILFGGIWIILFWFVGIFIIWEYFL